MKHRERTVHARSAHLIRGAQGAAVVCPSFDIEVRHEA